MVKATWRRGRPERWEQVPPRRQAVADEFLASAAQHVESANWLRRYKPFDWHREVDICLKLAAEDITRANDITHPDRER